ncbi:MetQ/NlpA family ABC transporter substrate-binding protein [Chitinasiproducens palmae]|uniref:Lipoprotein n=1 Tax=Chitinasiproducens palmae TaxID=1770053 RepID=A0A1H2PXZ1_9BURK|nr:MetQ/NlpA family ABC transporter substrate-binding protein [Chitinasiproducens palmae]SDV51529.1 D-methionine transport system substrate-binding protein [Chitinasiproducens palmae]
MIGHVKRALVAAVAVVGFGALASQASAETLKIGASAVPHAEILNFVKPKLASEGVTLQIVEFSDYVQPNAALADKQLDANFFQHKPYLDSFNKNHGTNIVPVPNGNVHIEPFGVYSRKVKDLKTLKDGATVAIPNDPSNGGRALLLLQKAGLLKLKDPSNLLATPLDVSQNPKHLKFRELEAAQLPRALDDVDIALINTNYALQAGLNPTRDALLIESKDSPYANFIAARPDNANSPALRKLVNALHTPETRQFIVDKYKGAIVPAF